jgi:lipopolysaccharide export system protein LptC
MVPVQTEERAARRGRAMERWRRRSRLIHRFRKILPASIAAILVLLGGWVAIRGLLIQLSDARDAAASIHMTNAHFFGRDGDGRAYVLSAREAARDDADYQRIRLRDALLALNFDSPAQTLVSADRGIYREDNRLLALSGHIHFRDPSGDDFLTQQAVVDTVNGALVGPGPVKGFGPTGTIQANSFEIFDRGQRVVFRGDVHSRLKRG